MSEHLSFAIAAWRSGRVRDAELACRQALAANPRNAAALNLLGVIAGSAGQHAMAANLMRQSVAIAPQEVSFRCNLVQALLASGDLPGAQSTLAEARQGGLENSELLILEGVVAGRAGNSSAAIQALEKAIQLTPESAVAMFNLGEAHRRAGHDLAAIEHFQRTLELDPQHADALNNLSGIFLVQGEFRQAIRCLERLLELRPHACQTYCNLGAALRAVGDVNQAIASFRRATALDSRALMPRFQLANLLVAAGEIGEGQQLLEQLSEQVPDNPEFLAARARTLERQGRLAEAATVLSTVPTDQQDAPPVAWARAVLAEQQGRVEDAIGILEAISDNQELILKEGWSARFRLGHCYDRIGDYDKAFANYQIANDRRRAMMAVPFDIERHAALVSQLMQSSSPESFCAQPTSDIDDDTPIFIVGMLRSGTSLVEQILDRHPDVHGGGELRLFGEILRQSGNNSVANTESTGSTDGRESSLSAIVNWNKLSASELSRIGRTYLEGLRGLAGDAPRATDKMPYNYLYLGCIRKALPRATIIHCRRHPLDTCLSCYFQDFLLGNEYTYDLRDLGAYYTHYCRLMTYWETLGIDICHVDYEQLVSDPENSIRQILRDCDLDWNPACLEFHKSARQINTASYQQVRQPIYTKSVHRWKNYQQHLGPLIESLGLEFAETLPDPSTI